MKSHKSWIRNWSIVELRALPLYCSFVLTIHCNSDNTFRFFFSTTGLLKGWRYLKVYYFFPSTKESESSLRESKTQTHYSVNMKTSYMLAVSGFVNNCQLLPSIINETISSGAARLIRPALGCPLTDWSCAVIDFPALHADSRLGWMRRNTALIYQYVSADVPSCPPPQHQPACVCLFIKRLKCSVCTTWSNDISVLAAETSLLMLLKKNVSMPWRMQLTDCENASDLNQ